MSNRVLIQPKQLNSRISDKFNQAIIQGLELEPKNRPQSIREFRELLGLANKSAPISTPQPQPKQQQNIPTLPPVNTIRLLQPENSSLLSKIRKIFIPENSTPQPNKPEVELKSDVGMDYSKLRDLLKAGKWKEADKETERVMLAVPKREKEGYLNTNSIDNFPCADLRTIDQLWVKYSNGRFGFSIQKRIYQGLGGTREYNAEIWAKFGDKVGWNVKSYYWLYYNAITFDKKAPEGHLPMGAGIVRTSQMYGYGGLGVGLQG